MGDSDIDVSSSFSGDSSDADYASSSDVDENEIWDDVPDSIQQDLESAPPLPEPTKKKKKYHLVQSHAMAVVFSFEVAMPHTS